VHPDALAAAGGGDVYYQDATDLAALLNEVYEVSVVFDGGGGGGGLLFF
jgi:hypothetical protein